MSLRPRVTRCPIPMSHGVSYGYGAKPVQPQVVGYPYGVPTAAAPSAAPAHHLQQNPYANYNSNPYAASSAAAAQAQAQAIAQQQQQQQQLYQQQQQQQRVASHLYPTSTANVQQHHHQHAPAPAPVAPAPANGVAPAGANGAAAQASSQRPQVNVPDVIEDKSLLRVGCGIKRYKTGKCIGRVRQSSLL